LIATLIQIAALRVTQYAPAQDIPNSVRDGGLLLRLLPVELDRQPGCSSAPVQLDDLAPVDRE